MTLREQILSVDYNNNIGNTGDSKDPVPDDYQNIIMKVLGENELRNSHKGNIQDEGEVTEDYLKTINRIDDI